MPKKVSVANVWFLENMWDKAACEDRSRCCTILTKSGELYCHYYHDGTSSWGWAKIDNLPEDTL